MKNGKTRNRRRKVSTKNEKDGINARNVTKTDDAKYKSTKKENQDDDDDDIKEIKNWISSMSHDELLHAMEFSFLRDPSSSSSLSSAVVDGGTAGRSVFATGINSNRSLLPTAATNNEYELLRRMIDLQRPPPIPIHPRAVSYKPASAACSATDGREDCQDEYRKMKRDRFEHPRLFQFFEQGVGLDGGTGGLLEDIPGIHEVDLPPEVLAAIGGGGGSGGVSRPKRNRNAQGSKQSRYPNDQNDNPMVHNNQMPYYDILTKKFTTAWGDVLSIGQTQNQRWADECILYGTRVFNTPSSAGGESVRCSFCWSNIIDGGGDLSDVMAPKLRHQQRGSKRSKNNKKENVWSMMQIATRGRFLTQSPKRSQKQKLNRPSYYAPWFDPTSEWFSLPTYLASRFEVAMWDSFYQEKKKTEQHMPGALSPPPPPSSHLADALRNVSDENIIQKAIVSAVYGVLSKEIFFELKKNGSKQQLDVSTAFVGKLRDTMLWQLLCRQRLSYWKSLFLKNNDSGGNDDSTTQLPSQLALKNIAVTPLIEIGSAEDTFRLAVRKHLQDSLSREAEKQLLKSMDDAASLKNGIQTSASVAIPMRGGGGKKSKKKRKNKNTKKQQQHLDPSKDRSSSAVDATDTRSSDQMHAQKFSHQPTSSSSASLTKLSTTAFADKMNCFETINEEEQLSDGEHKPSSSSIKSSSGEKSSFTASVALKSPQLSPSQSLSLPDLSTNPPSKERNEITIMTLVIIEEIMNNVFVKVGLASKKETKDQNKNDGWGSKTELQKTNKKGDVIKGARTRNSVGAINLVLKKSQLKQQTKSTVAAIPLHTERSHPVVNKDPTKLHYVAQELDRRNVNSSSSLAPIPSPITPPARSGNMMSLNDWQVQHQQQPQCPHNGILSFMDYPPVPPLSSSSTDNGNNFHHQEGIELHPSTYSSIGSSSFFEETNSSSLDMPRTFSNPFDNVGPFDGWMVGMKRYSTREKSLLAELFDKPHQPNTKKDLEEHLMVSSTAASIASSTGDEQSEIIREDDHDGVEENHHKGSDSDSTNEDENSNHSPSMDCDESKQSIEFVVDDADDVEEKVTAPVDINFSSVAPKNETRKADVVSGVAPAEVDPEIANETLNMEDHTKTRIVNSSSYDDTQNVERPETPRLSPSQSPSPEEPPTPPPQLSPILVSLADLGKLRKRTKSNEVTKERGDLTDSPKTSRGKYSRIVCGSLPSSPVLKSSSSKTLVPSWSREDLRISSFKEEPPLTPRKGRGMPRHTDALLSYRNAVAKSVRTVASTPSSSHEKRSASVAQEFDPVNAGNDSVKHKKNTGAWGKPPTVVPGFPNLHEAMATTPTAEEKVKGPIIDGVFHLEACAKSESALEGPEDSSHCNVIPRPSNHDDIDIMTSTKDGATTISSVPSPPETDEVSFLREERNAYRDKCLTLGAEVAKLKNLLASEKGNSSYPSSVPPYAASPAMQTCYFGNSSYDPEFMPPFFHGIPYGLSRTVAMSDAGIQRGEHESAISEDGTDLVGSTLVTDNQGGAIRAAGGHGGSLPGHSLRQTSSTGGTHTESDTSLDQQVPFGGPSTMKGFRRDIIGSVPMHGLQSRLTKDINEYLSSVSSQLRKQDIRRSAAMKRLFKLVNALWPRAQVKLYGSHVSNLCLPSSDLDFVVCLPAVHKNAPAEAPGVLEGRNAINETCQKLLARKLKSESWIDPRSIKIIERTVVPVIKVSTKDTRANVLQLDISFDSQEHHGLEAIDMILSVIEELPMVRPLVLVLKQFLLDRGLLTAYTGGLSSYCLFLMVTRYLQEQPSSWGDCGSLLMGFLDFYGNSFDPRATGISVRRRQYFSRVNPAQFAGMHNQQMWTVPPQQHPMQSSAPTVGMNGEFVDLSRRHSFNESVPKELMWGPGCTNMMNASPNTKHGKKPPRFQPIRSSSHHTFHPQMVQHTPQEQEQQQPPPPPQQQQEQPQQVPFVNSAKPYTFDPLFVEDPLSSSNNVGRNSFRIFQVKRAFADAHRALNQSLEWDISSTSDLNDDCPLLKCLLQSEDMLYELEDSRL